MTSIAFDGRRPGPPVGSFTYDVLADQWSWSDGVFALHGYSEHEVAPSTELLRKHQHPDDRTRACDVLQTVLADGRPFSCYHRVIDAQGSVRSVLTVGRGSTGSGHEVEQLTGFFVDLTGTPREDTRTGVAAAPTGIDDHDAVIEQAKGTLMASSGCDADAALAVLRRYSATTDIELHEVARSLVNSVGSPVRVPAQTRSRVADALHELSDRQPTR